MNRRALWLLGMIIAGSVLLRTWQLTARSLWFDEAFSWRLVQFSWAEMVARDATDVHPPLYYLALKSWSTVFGTSLLSLRSFSVTLAAVTAAALYGFTASAFHSRKAGLLAAALYAVAGYQIQFAWEARMYTLGTALAVLSTWALLSALRADRPGLWRWLLYGVLAAAFGYVHYYALFTLAAHAIFAVSYVLWHTRGRVGEILQWRHTWYALLAALTALVIWSPWASIFLAQNRQVQQSYWIPPIGGWAVPDTFYRMYAPTSGIPSHNGWWAVLAVVPIMATAALWLWLWFAKRNTAASRLVVACAAVPFLLSISLSLFTQSLYQDRYFLYAHVFILAGLAACIVRIPWRTMRGLVAVAAITGLAFASFSYIRELDLPAKPGSHAAAQYVFANRAGAEPVVVSSPFVYFAILHYAAEEFNAASIPKLYSETGELAHFAGGPILVASDIAGPDIFASTNEAVWVIDTSGFGGSPLVVPPAWQVLSVRRFPEVFGYQGEVMVTRYQRVL